MLFAPTKPSTRPKHFSLTELLLVIAAVVVLVSLLFPAMKTSLNKAKAISCVNNLRTLGHVLIEYADDHFGELPPGNPYPRYSKLWNGGYVQDHISSFTAAPDPTKLFGCPSEPSNHSADPSRDTENGNGYRGTHFGQNYWIGTQIRNLDPVVSVLVGESHAASYPNSLFMRKGDWINSQRGTSLNGRPDFRRHHDNHVALYFLDGRVIRTYDYPLD